MSCEQNLWTGLTSPTPGGYWVLKSVKGVTAYGSIDLDLSLDNMLYGVVTVTPGMKIPDGLNHDNVWWKPEIGDTTFNCNEYSDFVFSYDIDTVCGDPDAADVTWSIYHLCLPGNQTTTLCQINNNYSLLNLLRDAAGDQTIPATGGNWSGPGAGSYFTQSNDNNGGNDTFNPLTAGTGTYVYTYSVDIDGGGTCVECADTVDLTITVDPLTGAGTGGTITTCV